MSTNCIIDTLGFIIMLCICKFIFDNVILTECIIYAICVGTPCSQNAQQFTVASSTVLEVLLYGS